MPFNDPKAQIAVQESRISVDVCKPSYICVADLPELGR